MIGTRGEVDPAAKLPIIAKRENGAKIIEAFGNPSKTHLKRTENGAFSDGKGAKRPSILRLLSRLFLSLCIYSFIIYMYYNDLCIYTVYYILNNILSLYLSYYRLEGLVWR